MGNESVTNCWDFMKCGRVPGGENVEELGICPAYTYGAGQACWLVAGTFCGGKAQGTFAQKQGSCLACEFYQEFDPEHRSRMRREFRDLVFMTAILDTIDALVVVLDRQGQIVRFNRACEQATGYSFEEVSGKYFWDFLLIPEEKESVKAVVEELRSARFPNAHENYWVTKSGERRLISWSNTVIQDEEGAVTHVIGTGIDITERRRAEGAIRESENRYRQIVDTAHEGISLADADRRFRFVNRRLASILGYSVEELLGHPIEDFLPPEVRCKFLETWERRRQGVTEQYDLLLHGKGGRESWVHVNTAPVLDEAGRFVGALGMLTDITDRKQAEQRQQESDERVRLLLNSTAEGILGTDKNGNCTFANPASLRLLGYDDPSQLLGRNLHLLCHHSRAEGTPYPVEECRGSQAVHRGENIHVDDEVFWRADGTCFPAEYWSYPVLRGEEVFGGVVAFLDITERKRAEDAIRQSREELRVLAGGLISAKEGEARRIARDLHDAFGQKLAVLNLQFSELEGLLASGSHPALEKLRPLREGIGSLAKHIHQLSRQLHPAVLQELGLEIAVETECANYSAQEGISVDFSSENVPESVPDDVALCLYRVLQESLQNIRKHARARTAAVKLNGVEDQIVLVVEDSGNGFELAESRKKGGLGLASMEERIRLVGGTLAICSTPGEGTRIEARAPAGRQ